jgi:hypothetical protein
VRPAQALAHAAQRFQYRETYRSNDLKTYCPHHPAPWLDKPAKVGRSNLDAIMGRKHNSSVRIASNLQRQPLARKLYEQGFTEQQIADQFGVSQATIAGDLQSLSGADKLHERTSKRGRKNEGRPKGSGRKAPSRHPRADDVVTRADENMTVKDPLVGQTCQG